LMGRYGLKVHPKERKIYAECKIRLLDQKRGQHMEREGIRISFLSLVFLLI
jgi:hypothetical protein